MINSLRNLLRDGCTHDAAGWPMRPAGVAPDQPQRGKQICCACGMYRYITIGGSATSWTHPAAARKVAA